MITEDQRFARQDWVRETSFGSWFLSTDTWVNRVLKIAMDDLESLMTSKLDHYPTILDVGFGRGHSLPMLDQRFRPEKIIGLEIDPMASEWAKDKVSACASDVQLITGNAASMELPDMSVDMVLCHQALHHIVDQTGAVKEFYRVLKPGGVLLFAESCRKFIDSWPVRILFRHPMNVQKTDLEYLRLLQHTGFVTPTENISRPYLWWSRIDFGLLELLGKKVPKEKEETLINVIAYRLK